MKLISWNVNGLRACVQKGFLDYFVPQMPISSASRNPSCRKDRSHSICRIITNTGIMPKKRATPALLFLPKKNHLTSHAASEPPSVIPKAG